jgi:hypothetical protein
MILIRHYCQADESYMLVKLCTVIVSFMYVIVRSVGASHSATGAIESTLKYVSPDAHWIACRLATAGGKRIKMRPLGTVVTSRYYVYNETTARLHVQQSPTSKRPTTCPASAEPVRALPTGMNLRSAAVTADTTHRQPSADQLGRLPTRCPLNPACCCPSVPALVVCKRPLSGPQLAQCQYRASAP